MTPWNEVTYSKTIRRSRLTAWLIPACAVVMTALSAGIVSLHTANEEVTGSSGKHAETNGGGSQARQLLLLNEEVERLAGSAVSRSDSARLLQACRMAGDGYRVMGNDARAVTLYKRAVGIALRADDKQELATLTTTFSTYTTGAENTKERQTCSKLH